MTTTTRLAAIPFSPLTTAELHERQDRAAWAAVCSLTVGDRHPSLANAPGLARDALVEARRANEYHDAAMARADR